RDLRVRIAQDSAVVCARARMTKTTGWDAYSHIASWGVFGLLVNRCFALGAALEAAMHPIVLFGNMLNLGFEELIGQQRIGCNIATRVILQRLENAEFVSAVIGQHLGQEGHDSRTADL